MIDLIADKHSGDILFFVTIRVGILLTCWLFMIVSNLIDFWSGVTTAKALGQALMSHGFRRTVTKIGDYIKVMLFALMFDVLGSLLSFYVAPFATMLCTIAIMCIEGRSVIENSRRKKAHAGDIPDIVKKIVQATTAEQGHKIVEEITKAIANIEKDNEKN